MESGVPNPGNEAREIELALVVSPAVLERLAGNAMIGPVLTSESYRLMTVYYDTADFDLLAAGVALRVRAGNGRFTQAVKTWGTSKGGVKDRREVIAGVAGLAPEPEKITEMDLRKTVLTALGDKALIPIFETDIDRRSAKTAVPGGGGIVDIAVDCGDIRAGDNCLPVHEIELELIEGPPRILYGLGLDLAASVPVRMGVFSKADRGYALAQKTPLRAVKAVRPDLDPGMNAETAFLACAHRALDQVLANEPVVMETRSPEGVHQMRVGLRRLRALLALYYPLMSKEVLAPFGKGARALAVMLGAVRDLDVVQEDVVGPVAKSAGDDAGLKALAERLETRRVGAREVLTGDLGASSRVAEFALTLAQGLDEAPWREGGGMAAVGWPAIDYARKMLSYHAKRVRKRGKYLARLNTEERHRLRIEVKKLRYASGFFGALFDKDAVRAYERTLSRLQNLFGALNDLAVAREVLPILAGGAGDPLLTQAVGQVLGWHEARALEKWNKVRTRFAEWRAMKPFWD